MLLSNVSRNVIKCSSFFLMYTKKLGVILLHSKKASFVSHSAGVSCILLSSTDPECLQYVFGSANACTTTAVDNSKILECNVK